MELIFVLHLLKLIGKACDWMLQLFLPIWVGRWHNGIQQFARWIEHVTWFKKIVTLTFHTYWNRKEPVKGLHQKHTGLPSSSAGIKIVRHLLPKDMKAEKEFIK